MRIVSFGTSLSAGGGWQAGLRARLREELGADIQVLIHAKPGANSDWGVETLPNVLELEPDLVVIEFAINDASLLRGVSLARSRANMVNLVMALQAGAPERKIVLMTMNPAFGLKRMVRPLLGQYYALCEQLATELRVGFADLRPAWAALPEVRRAIPDGLHPTPEAARSVIVPGLSEVIVAMQ
ncbi:MAG: family esterase protein [Hyphomicrobiales bacterium]|nr:family esterase protein [Hyphomicrobiales bacterium]